MKLGEARGSLCQAQARGAWASPGLGALFVWAWFHCHAHAHDPCAVCSACIHTCKHGCMGAWVEGHAGLVCPPIPVPPSPPCPSCCACFPHPFNCPKMCRRMHFFLCARHKLLKKNCLRQHPEGPCPPPDLPQPTPLHFAHRPQTQRPGFTRGAVFMTGCGMMCKN